MSQHEKTKSSSSLVMVENNVTSKHKSFRPIELDDQLTTTLTQTKSIAPAAPYKTVIDQKDENLEKQSSKSLCPNTCIASHHNADVQDVVLENNEKPDSTSEIESRLDKLEVESSALNPEHSLKKNPSQNMLAKLTSKVMKPSEIRQKQEAVQKLSSKIKSRVSAPETIELVSIHTTNKKIPSLTRSLTPTLMPQLSVDMLNTEKPQLTDKADETEILEQDDVVKEIGSPEPITSHNIDWSDDEEAGGLPRLWTTATTSRLFRAVRQLICCGSAYIAASEDNVSVHRHFSGI